MESVLFAEKYIYIYINTSPCSVRLGKNFTTELLLMCSVFSRFYHFSFRLHCIFLKWNQKMNKCLKQKKQESTYRTNEKKFGCKIPAQPYTARACIDVDINIFFNKQDRFNYSKQKCRYVFLFFSPNWVIPLEQTFSLQ